MPRKSTLTNKMACGVSIFAIVGTVCWIAGPDHVQAGSLRANKTMVRAGISKVSGLKRSFQVKSRANTRLTVSKRRLQAKRFSNSRRLSKSTSSRRIKNTAPAIGNSRFSIVGADSRLQKLGKSTTKPAFPRNSGFFMPSKHDVAEKKTNRTGTIRPLHDRVLVRRPDETSKKHRITSTSGISNKKVTETRGNLPVLKGSKINQNGSAGGYTTTIRFGRDAEAGLGKWGGDGFDLKSLENDNAVDQQSGNETIRWKIHSAFNSRLNRENEPRTKEKAGAQTSWFGNYRPQFYFRAIDEKGNDTGAEGGARGHYSAKFYLRPWVQSGADAVLKNALTDNTGTSSEAIVRKPPVIIFDEPTATQSDDHAETINILSWQWGAGQSGKRPANLRGATATHDANGAVPGVYVPTIDMVSGTTEPGDSGGTGDKAFEIDSFDMRGGATLIPERQRLEFLKLLGLPVRSATPDTGGNAVAIEKLELAHEGLKMGNSVGSTGRGHGGWSDIQPLGGSLKKPGGGPTGNAPARRINLGLFMLDIGTTDAGVPGSADIFFESAEPADAAYINYKLKNVTVTSWSINASGNDSAAKGPGNAPSEARVEIAKGGHGSSEAKNPPRRTKYDSITLKRGAMNANGTQSGNSRDTHPDFAWVPEHTADDRNAHHPLVPVKPGGSFAVFDNHDRNANYTDDTAPEVGDEVLMGFEQGKPRNEVAIEELSIAHEKIELGKSLPALELPHVVQQRKTANPSGGPSATPFGHKIGLGHEHQNPNGSTGATSSRPSFGAGLAQPLFEGNSHSSTNIRMQQGRVAADADHNEGTPVGANVAFRFNPETLSRTESNTSAGANRAETVGGAQTISVGSILTETVGVPKAVTALDWNYTKKEKVDKSARFDGTYKAAGTTHNAAASEIYDYPGYYAHRFDGIDDGGTKPGTGSNVFAVWVTTGFFDTASATADPAASFDDAASPWMRLQQLNNSGSMVPGETGLGFLKQLAARNGH